MSIQEIVSEFKRVLSDRDTLTAGLLITVGISSFFLGKLSVDEVERVSERVEIRASSADTEESTRAVEPISSGRKEPVSTENISSGPAEGGYVASKSGTKYHLPWCGSAKQIKEENKIWFATKAEAEAAGYTPAANCKGI